jgi:signal transduction histidine kinase/CheY-like chemotaxis protein
LKTLLVQWIEWIISVPLMVYIVLTLEVNKTKLTTREGACVVCTLIALLLASSSSWTVVAQAKNGSLFAIASAIATMGFVYVNFAYIIRDTQTSVKSIKTGSMDQIQDLRTIINRTAQLKISGLCYLYFALSIFPLLFIAKWIGLLNDDLALAIVVFFSFYVKHCFNAYLIEKQVAMLNPTTYVLHRERANNDSRRAFLRYVLHEVRVPLNSISMGLALLGMNQDVIAEESETVDMMSAAVGFMSDTLNEVLSMQKIEEGKLEMHYAPCNLLQIVHKVHMTLMGQLKGKDLKWVFIPPPSEFVDVIADNFRIEHVLSNLAGNAIKFSPRGAKITCKIERDPLVAERVDENGGTVASLLFSIYDEGLGVKPEEQKKLFQKFSQINSGLELQEGKGSGMGLHICKEIISLHGGFVGVNSPSPLMPAFSANKGSLFYFSLPLLIAPSSSATNNVAVVTTHPPKQPQTEAVPDPVVVADPAAPVAPAARATVTSASPSGSDPEETPPLPSLRCLVVDDVKSNRMLLGMLLTKRGILNDQVDDGDTCIKAVKAQSPGYYDFIFIDNYMPIMGGLETVRALRTDPSSDFFIVGLTGESKRSPNVAAPHFFQSLTPNPAPSPPF